MRYLRAMIVIASFGVGLVGHRAHAADEVPNRWEEIIQRVSRTLDRSELSEQQKQQVLANLKQTLAAAAEAEQEAAAAQPEPADQQAAEQPTEHPAEHPFAGEREEADADQTAATASERRQMRAEQRERRREAAREVAREMAREALDEAIESRRETRPQRGRSRESRELQEPREREQGRQRVSDREQDWNRWPSPFAIGVILETSEDEDGEQQLKISEVFPDSPAAEAGLEDGDVVVKVAGRRVSEPHAVTWRVHRAGMEGNTVLLEVQRGEQTHTIEVRPEARAFGGRSIAAAPWGFTGPPAMPGVGARPAPRGAQPSEREELVELKEQVQMLREETKELQDLVRQLLQQQDQAPQNQAPPVQEPDND